MRLLRADVDELELVTVNEDDAKYAILSHRCLADEEEVTFDDIRHSSRDIQAKPGWTKLQNCKSQAVEDGLLYIWADTCCVDKSSSQELTESINSMYRWYQNAECCYVYLHDMPDPSAPAVESDPPLYEEDSIDISTCKPVFSTTSISVDREAACHVFHSACDESKDDSILQSPLQGWDREAFGKCQWFTRGWTLQEMLASRRVKFYSCSWNFIAHLSDIAIEISKITGIHKEALTHVRHVKSYSIAQRLSWAAGRRTTRIEDRAYSLLGLLDINIGVIYGEGNRAFQRLQDELLRTTSDQSLFVFETPKGSRIRKNLMADSPDCFKNSGDVILTPPIRGNQFQFVGKEVHLSLTTLRRPRWRISPLLGLVWAPRERNFKAILDCCLEHDGSKVVTLNVSSDVHDQRYVTFNPCRSRMEMMNISETLNASFGHETIKMMRNEDNYSSNMHNVTISCRVEGKISIVPENVPRWTIWNATSKTLTVRSNGDIRSCALSVVPNLSFLISLNNGRAHARLVCKDGRLFIKGSILEFRPFVYFQQELQVSWHHGRALTLSLLENGSLRHRRDLVLLDLTETGPVKGLYYSTIALITSCGRLSRERPNLPISIFGCIVSCVLLACIFKLIY